MQDLLIEMRDLELTMAELYQTLARCFAEDGEFFKRIADEEREHAAAVQQVLDEQIWSPEETGDEIEEMIITLRNDNASARRSLALLKQGKIKDRSGALQLALALEQSAGEVHGRRLLEQNKNQSLERLLRVLYGMDEGHVTRLRKRLQTES